MRKLLLLLPLFLFQCGGQDVYLKFQFSEKTNHQYRLQFDLQSQMEKTRELYTTSGRLRFSQLFTHLYPNGDAKCLIRVDSVSQTSNHLSSAEQEHLSLLLLHSPLHARLSPYGDFLEMEKSVEIPSVDFFGLDLARFLIELYPILPHSGMPIGGEWDREQQFPFENEKARGTLYCKKHFKLAGMEKKGNRPCARIEMDLLIHISIPKEAAFQIKTEGGAFAKGKATLYFDIAEGCFIQGDGRLAGAVEASMQTPEGRFATPMKFEQKMHLTLLEPEQK